MGLNSYLDHDMGEWIPPVPLCCQPTCDRDTVFGAEPILFVASRQASEARGGRSNRLEVTITKSLQKSQLKRSNILRKIKIEGNVDKGRDIIVCHETAALKKWEGFKSQMGYGLKFTGRFDEQRKPKPKVIAMNLIPLVCNDLRIPRVEG